MRKLKSFFKWVSLLFVSERKLDNQIKLEQLKLERSKVDLKRLELAINAAKESVQLAIELAKNKPKFPKGCDDFHCKEKEVPIMNSRSLHGNYYGNVGEMFRSLEVEKEKQDLRDNPIFARNEPLNEDVINKPTKQSNPKKSVKKLTTTKKKSVSNKTKNK